MGEPCSYTITSLDHVIYWEASTWIYPQMHVHIQTLIITNMTPVVEVLILQTNYQTASSGEDCKQADWLRGNWQWHTLRGKSSGCYGLSWLMKLILWQSLSNELKAQTSVREVSERLLSLSLKTKTRRYHKSFPPTAIRLDNVHLILSV